MEKSKLTEVKAILKSLVLSSTEKITIDRLNRDYRDVEGEFIPFRRLGYGNLEQFLRSIPDTLMVSNCLKYEVLKHALIYFFLNKRYLAMVLLLWCVLWPMKSLIIFMI